MNEPIDVHFNSVPVVDALRDLAKRVNVRMVIDAVALESVGVDPDATVTLRHSNIPIDQAMDLVLKQAGRDDLLEPIGFCIYEGVVHVGMVRTLPRVVEVRVYDVRDLLVQTPGFAGAPEFDINSALG